MSYRPAKYDFATFRLTHEEKAMLKRMAAAECRSLNNLIYSIVRQEIDRYEELKLLNNRYRSLEDLEG